MNQDIKEFLEKCSNEKCKNCGGNRIIMDRFENFIDLNTKVKLFCEDCKHTVILSRNMLGEVQTEIINQGEQKNIESEFQIGDLVMVTKTNIVGKITSKIIICGKPYYKLDVHHEDLIDESRLKIVPTPKFKVGELVKVWKHSIPSKAGTVGIIKSMEFGGATKEWLYLLTSKFKDDEYFAESNLTKSMKAANLHSDNKNKNNISVDTDMDILKHIKLAVEEAQRRQIKANTIIIDENLAYTNQMLIPGHRDVYSVAPPMIFGLKIVYQKNLTEDLAANFILTEGKVPESEINALRNRNKELEEKIEKIKELLGGIDL